ncbi:hypothetical protein SAMN04488029_3518 [Reichenbachiella faecimaris]|uniref:Uncharacterized protein n=1 Tax=Reichenbachiella faecimaris TaxID=692418 RepID=A0A1W2GMH5_REIFA|nr:hypothetical protein [Reichenbachiella faecimaris]SMD37880.1 hypothetical protein SAMN04488029_3518 [Reichenbachiella faecimaris]
MKNLTIEDLAGQEYQLDLNFETIEKSTKVADRRLWTYLTAYPYIIDFFNKLESINPTELIIGNAVVYGWMPTTMNLRTNDLEAVLAPLNQLKKEKRKLNSDEFSQLKLLVNNSVTGTSKLLHFIQPEVYPIWDSRVNRFISGSTKDTNTISAYEEYLLLFDEIAGDKRFVQLISSLTEKLDYTITAARAFEMIMYLSDLFKLERVPRALSEANTTSSVSIPRYKRDVFVFISNLGEVTADPLNPSTLKRDGYLLSEHYTNTDSVERALWVRSRKNLLISDNGNWTRMSGIAKKLREEGEILLNLAKDEMSNNGSLSENVLDQRNLFIEKVAQVCAQEVENLDVKEIIRKQLLIKPHYMIGMEDFTIPVLMMCGMLDETFNPKASEILTFQKKTRAYFSRQAIGEFGFGKEMEFVAKFLVLHTYDYESALQGAKGLKEVAKDGVAISYGAPMQSRRWITRLQFGEQWDNFEEKLPEPYLIAQSMTLGVVNGLQNDTPVHILGVGTPILIALTGYLLRDSKAVSIDSSAPFKDAYASKIYGSRSALLKMDMYRVAALAIINNQPYESKTPFYQAFEKKYPSNWEGIKEHLSIDEETDYRELAKALEDQQQLVEKYIPFFTKMRGGGDTIINDLRIARSGHNYWVLKEICMDIKDRKDSPEKLKLWTEEQIERYKRVGSKKWAMAVEKAYRVSEKYRYTT